MVALFPEEKVKTTILERVDGKNYLTTVRAAEFLGVAHITIRKMLGYKLTRFKFKTLTLISKKELKTIMERKNER